MDALQTVFDTILNVFNIIREFFESLFAGFGKDDAAADDDTTEA